MARPAINASNNARMTSGSARSLEGSRFAVVDEGPGVLRSSRGGDDVVYEALTHR